MIQTRDECRRFMTIGAANGITIIIPLNFFLKRREKRERIAAKQYSYSPGASSRQECQEDCRRMSPSEIIARYRPRSEESFISDFWATEARKSDTPPLSRNFGRLIITSRAEDSHARRRRRAINLGRNDVIPRSFIK